MNKNKTIDYVELPASDLEAAKSFFSTVFGWKFTDYGDTYTAFTDDRLDGGFYKSELGSRTASGSALIVVYSDDLESMLADVKSNGGSIEKDIFSFPGGRRFHFLDPNGNEFAVWSDEG